MYKDKISIIVPVYNVEEYLRKCLDSILNQTFTDLEILLVDDGSTDQGGRICDEYALRDSRIRVFHKENGGLSSALNIGLQHATGKYIGFVDSDDWIEPGMYQILLDAINREHVPVSVAGYFKDTDAGSVPVSNKETIPHGRIDVREMLLYPLQRDFYLGFCGYVWNKLYLADIIRGSSFCFDESIKYGMDILFYTTLIMKRRCAGVYTDQPVYHYYQRKTAISKSRQYPIKYDILTVYKRVEALLKDGGYADISFWARGFYCHHASVIAEIAWEEQNREILEKMQGEIRACFADYMETNQMYPEKFERIYRILRA